MSFETAIHCDGCGNTIYTSHIVTKYLIVNIAREEGWSIGKYHLCSECKKNIGKLKKEGWIR